MSLLNNICELRKETCSPHESNSPVYVGLEHIDSGRFFLSRHGSPAQVRSAKSRFYPGDVLYGKLRPYLDKAVVAETEGICSTDILVLEPIEVPSWFLCGILHSDAFLDHAKQTTHGVNHPRTSWSGIKVFETLSLDPLEQKKIAAVLLKIQRAIEMQKKIIKSLRALKKSTMQYLFTYGLRGEKTKMTKIGEIPEGWKVVQLRQIASIERGKFSHRPRNDPAYYGGHIPFIQTGDITQSNGRIRAYTQTLNQRGFSVSKVFPAGTILITIAANIGDTGILEFDSAFPDSIIGITPSDDLDGEYLEFYLQTQKHKMNLLAPKGTQRNINIEFLKPWPVKLPSVPEQRNIAHAIGSVGRKLEMHESKKSALQNIFKTMLNKLMTSEIRVSDLDIDVSEVNV